MRNNKIELLSPAKNVEIGVAAINHGADAVYIGAPKFGARQAAGNSLADIRQLVDYAHRFWAKVYVTLNTILDDAELAETQQLIVDLYEIEVDALIVQDMGILELDLPPIPLHASTQCDNRTVEKVQFLEKCGFDQVVLARELSLEQIRTIAAQTSVPLECFVHGALCVSYSGQCYLSQALRQRSANRGACAQMCRLPYTLVDADGKILAENKHLLSLKDFDASAYIAQLIEAGVSSFKIEGRLKGINYVKNLTAFYRQKIDAVLDGTARKRASSGKTQLFFEPNPQKTFYRGATNYFLEGRTADITSFDTPKSLGEPVGTVKYLSYNSLTLDSDKNFSNGDGLCCLNSADELVGFRVNRAEGNRIFQPKMPANLKIGTQIFRNNDLQFEKMLAGKSSERKIEVIFRIDETADGLAFLATDEDGVSAGIHAKIEKQLANNAERAIETLRTQFSKLGNTDFSAAEIVANWHEPLFIPASQLAEFRRQLIEKLQAARLEKFPKQEVEFAKTSHEYFCQSLDYQANAFNQRAEQFYRRHGAKVVQRAFEAEFVEGAELMRTKHCLRYSFGWCPKQKPQSLPREPLILKCGSADLRLTFDCKNCEMVIQKIGNAPKIDNSKNASK